MAKILVALVLGLALTASAYAQVAPETTGGPSGGPNQSQSVVKSGTTGGRSGGPNQSEYKKLPPAKKERQKSNY